MLMVGTIFTHASRSLLCSIVLIGLILSLVAIGWPVAAQSTTSGDDARIKERIEKVGPERPVAPEKDIETQVTPAEPAPSSQQSFSFVLSAVVIDGVTVFSPGDLGSAYVDFLAR